MAEHVDRFALRDALYDADAITMQGVKIINQFPTAVDAATVRWIPVTERLPDRTMPPHDVLVYHDLTCGMFIDRAWYSHEKNKWRSAVGMNLKVTHWMPLPEPPEAEAALQKGDTHEANPV